jgi:hypothetical protein
VVATPVRAGFPWYVGQSAYGDFGDVGAAADVALPAGEVTGAGLDGVGEPDPPEQPAAAATSRTAMVTLVARTHSVCGQGDGRARLAR